MGCVRKISIIGSGAVGAGLAYNLLSRLSFKELVLIDIAPGLARGVSLDLEDTRGFLGFNTKVSGSENIAKIKGSDIVVITAGIARKKGMTRADLLKINAAIAKETAKKIRLYAPGAIVIAVTNPLDVITYIVRKYTKFSRKRVIGMGSSLDTSRLLNILHKRLKISTTSMEAFVFGPHSKDMIVSPKRIKVKGKNLSGLLKSKEARVVADSVKLRGAEIVAALKTKSAHFAPSLSCCNLIEAIALNKNEVIPVSVELAGEYGMKDMCTGTPCVINRDGISKVLSINLTQDEKKQIQKAKKLFKECMMSL